MEHHEELNKQEILEFAVECGKMLLQNGAEIFRVEETIELICKHYDIEDLNTFVLSNGIFVTAKKEREDMYAKVTHVPLRGAHLGRVDAINNLSRQICSGNISLENAAIRLEEIEEMPEFSNLLLIGASGFGSAAFCYLMGGTVLDSLFTLVSGMILYLLLIKSKKWKWSKMITNISGGALITIFAVIAFAFAGSRLPITLDKMIVGAILPMVPGVGFVNSIRDIANSDFLSGTVRMIDTLLSFIYIAVGVGLVLITYADNFGGVIV